MEPLYQYINTAEFLREREPSTQGETPAPSDFGGATGGKKQNQLELARQLSMRKLWCELPEIIQSGVLDTLTSEERKLQEVCVFVCVCVCVYVCVCVCVHVHVWSLH